MKLVCELGRGVQPDVESFRYYELSANIVRRLVADLQDTAPTHIEAIESFCCEVESSPEKAGVEPWKPGPIFTIKLKIGVAETDVRRTWRQIGEKTKQPTVDDVVRAFMQEHDDTQQLTEYKNSVLARSLEGLIQYVAEHHQEQRRLLGRLKAMR